MSAITSTALDLLTGGLRNINALEAGEPLQPNDAADALQVLNDLLDSLSTDKLFVYTAKENIVTWTPGQNKYTIGNPVQGTFVGNLTVGSPLLTAVVNSASLNITFGINASGLVVGGTITDVQGLLPAGTTIVSINTGIGTITLSQNAIASYTGDLFTYTAPGNFEIDRPLRIRPGYTRITASGNTGLDYWFDVCAIDDYNEIGYKGVPGPWPYLVSYQTTFPYGTLWIYPNPQQAGEVHLWTDVVLTNLLSPTQVISLPQGYSRCLKKLLAMELAPEYGKTVSAELARQCWEARTFIRSMNEVPVKKLRYDSALMAGNGVDASFIMHGGFGSNL